MWQLNSKTEKVTALSSGRVTLTEQVPSISNYRQIKIWFGG